MRYFIACIFLGVASLTYAQSTGGPGDNNPITIKRISLRWDFTAFPGATLQGIPGGQAPFAEPDLEEVPQGQPGQAVTWQFCMDPDSDEGLTTTAKVMANWAEGTPFRVWMAWSPTTAVAGDVVWCFACTLTNADGVWPQPTTICATVASPGVTDQLTNTFLASLPTVGLDHSGGGTCALWRDASDGADTYGADACFAGALNSFQIDSIGLDTEFAKD